MKKLLYLALPLALGLGACNMADDADYESMANDICDCMNKNTEGVSEGMKNAVIDATNAGKDPQQAIMEYSMKNPDAAISDSQVLTAAGPKIEQCATELEKKYENVYSNETEEEVQKRLLETLKKNKSCGWSYALIKMGMDMQ